MNYRALIPFLLISILSFHVAYAQENTTQEQLADRFHKDYKFNEAIDIYRKILEESLDSLHKISIEKKIILSENGKAMLDFASSPVVIAQKESEINSFFLSYPMFQDKSWFNLNTNFSKSIDIPSQKNFPAVVYFPNGAKQIIFSSPDNSGSWNLYNITQINDTLWSAPNLLNEYITSIGNEILPVISEDGKRLYFSSNGHYGMGGYDLYMSDWDDSVKDWGIPQNMGFPYSSTSDDYLFYISEDGKYSLFSSNRNSDEGEIETYVTEYDSNPLKKMVTEQDARDIARMNIKQEEIKEKETNKTNDNNDLSVYTTAVKDVRKLQQSIREEQKKINANRELYATLSQEEQTAMQIKISNQENLLLSLQQDLNFAQTSLQKIEIDFLSKGIIIMDQDEESQKDTKDLKENYIFANNNLGIAPKLTILDPEPEIDLSFKIQDEAMIAELEDLPKEGLIYQIQLFVISNKASIKGLKGLSPVFERKTPTGKYLYTVGIFHTYNETLKNLNRVKKQGFPNAIITAYNNGKSTSVANARAIEKKEKETTLIQVVIEGIASLPPDILQIIKESTDKDIARATEDGVTKFVIGPFNNRTAADKLMNSLENAGLSGVKLENL